MLYPGATIKSDVWSVGPVLRALRSRPHYTVELTGVVDD